MIEHLHGTSFDWLSWQGGTLSQLGLISREQIILSNSNIIKKYAIGYCKGEQLLCKPKLNTVAIMFLKDDNYFWTHFTIKEFNIIFRIK